MKWEVEIPAAGGELAGGVDGLVIRATVVVPADGVGVAPVVLVCWPGGSYGRGYWDLQIPGRSDHSFAEYMAGQGFVVIAADPLGVGDSDRPADGRACTLVAMAGAAAQFVSEVRRRVASGELVEGLGPMADPAVVGVGHSMGALLAVVEQVLFHSYTATCLLGLRFLQTVHEGLGLDEATLDAEEKLAVATAHVKLGYGDAWTGPGTYGAIDRSPAQEDLNGRDAPADIIAFDNATSVSWPAASLIDAFKIGLIEEYVGELTGPAFMGFGEFETGRSTPHDHIPFFSAVNDLTLCVLPETYHCHHYQARRFDLWDRIGAWARTNAGGQRPATNTERAAATG